MYKFINIYKIKCTNFIIGIIHIIVWASTNDTISFRILFLPTIFIVTILKKNLNLKIHCKNYFYFNTHN